MTHYYNLCGDYNLTPKYISYAFNINSLIQCKITNIKSIINYTLKNYFKFDGD